jgi:hypothetical protein
MAIALGKCKIAFASRGDLEGGKIAGQYSAMTRCGLMTGRNTGTSVGNE